MEFKKIKPAKIYEQVANEIIEMIQKGELKPGDKLDPVPLLAEKFSVGRSAIREALMSLRALGYIELKQGEGTFVRNFDASGITYPISQAVLMDKEDVTHLLEVRKILEAGIAAMAAEKRTSSDLEEMHQALKEMKNATGNEELGEQADLDFHLALVRATRNPLLAQLMNQVSDTLVKAMKETRRILLFSNPSTFGALFEQHALILREIETRNPEKARHAMLSHLQFVEKNLEDYLV
ncbi:HTH-type transcriptional regulator LutR [Weizmannia acidilactici]|uniref:HTH-type transcriptional regulator LutR n=1 Tax=Weizmannia acidilactici TaxID=2607726 RepID=A0A5J4J5W0_9BACI|nr:FadR/GntR family transcriptional regulator [Weizmannia acidilactici]GER67088.1 HTH-type transcriptional regulator LutR [Weizmannia acidilactici]GER70326.1 HTH-type transcriptional regulator LutR [Weizmannia acidilactici]GER73570.1 HTH-type transcriptional regulator LutR [Weizmannia acidilactici]